MSKKQVRAELQKNPFFLTRLSESLYDSPLFPDLLSLLGKIFAVGVEYFIPVGVIVCGVYFGCLFFFLFGSVLQCDCLTYWCESCCPLSVLSRFMFLSVRSVSRKTFVHQFLNCWSVYLRLNIITLVWACEFLSRLLCVCRNTECKKSLRIFEGGRFCKCSNVNRLRYHKLIKQHPRRNGKKTSSYLLAAG